MLAPTFHHLSETIAYLADLINLPAGYCVGLIGLLMALGLALAVGLARRRARHSRGQYAADQAEQRR